MGTTIYKNFDLNDTTTVKPWAPRELQAWKDAIDTMVIDCISADKQAVGGHKHGRMYNPSAGVGIEVLAAGVVQMASLTADGVVVNDVDGKLSTIPSVPVAKGGTNSLAALTNDLVMISSGDAIVEGVITTTELAILDDMTGLATGAGDNDKFATQGYVDDNLVPPIIPISRGGTNSDAALNNDRVMISTGGAIVESSSITTSELALLNGMVSISLGGANNDKLVSQGYVDDALVGNFWARNAGAGYIYPANINDVLGIGTLVPFKNVCVADGDFDVNKLGVHIKSVDDKSSLLVIEGWQVPGGAGTEEAAAIVLADNDGATDAKMISFQVGGGVAKFSSLIDVQTTEEYLQKSVDDILVMDLTTGNIGYKNAPNADWRTTGTPYHVIELPKVNYPVGDYTSAIYSQGGQLGIVANAYFSEADNRWNQTLDAGGPATAFKSATIASGWSFEAALLTGSEGDQADFGDGNKFLLDSGPAGTSFNYNQKDYDFCIFSSFKAASGVGAFKLDAGTGTFRYSFTDESVNGLQAVYYRAQNDQGTSAYVAASDDDVLTDMIFRGTNDKVTLDDVDYARFRIQAIDVTETAEYGAIIFSEMVAGTLTDTLFLSRNNMGLQMQPNVNWGSSYAVFSSGSNGANPYKNSMYARTDGMSFGFINQAGYYGASSWKSEYSGVRPIQLELGSTEFFFKTAAVSTVSPNDDVDFLYDFHISGGAGLVESYLYNTAADGNIHNFFHKRQNTSGVDQVGVADDAIFTIQGIAHNDNATPEEITYGSMLLELEDPTDGAEIGRFSINLMEAGSSKTPVTIRDSEMKLWQDRAEIDGFIMLFRKSRDGGDMAANIDTIGTIAWEGRESAAWTDFAKITVVDAATPSMKIDVSGIDVISLAAALFHIYQDTTLADNKNVTLGGTGFLACTGVSTGETERNATDPIARFDVSTGELYGETP